MKQKENNKFFEKVSEISIKIILTGSVFALILMFAGILNHIFTFTKHINSEEITATFLTLGLKLLVITTAIGMIFDINKRSKENKSDT